MEDEIFTCFDKREWDALYHRGAISFAKWSQGNKEQAFYQDVRQLILDEDEKQSNLLGDVKMKAIEEFRKELHESYAALAELTATDHFSLIKVVAAHHRLHEIIKAMVDSIEGLGEINSETVKESLLKK